jgi:hypothetical protein
MPEEDPRLLVYRVLYVDIELLSDSARFLRDLGHPERAKQIEGVIERARQNPYREPGENSI